jgi:signal transduction histidine kinase/Tfp pilus assembly protein PilF
MPLKRIISVIITGLLLLPSFYCFAQQFLLDSLVKRLKATTINDTNYVNTLSGLGVLYQHRDKDSLLLIADRIIDVSKKINYTRGYANGHKIKGIAYIYLLKKERALFHDSIAIAEYTKINDIKGIGAVYNNMAVLLNSYGEYNSANIFYQKSITYRKQVNDLKGVGDCETNMGNNKMAVGDYNGALIHMLKGLSIRKEIHDLEGLSNSYTNLGNLYFHMRNYKKSEESYRESFRIKQKIGSFAELANLFINLGGVYYQKGQYDTASLYFDKALKISKEKNEVESIVIALNNISELASSKKDYAGAFKAVEEAEKYVNPNIDNESKIVLNNRKAICYSNVKQYPSAIKHASLALETAKKINAKRSLTETSELLSELYEKNGNNIKALFYYKLAKKYSDSVFNEENMTKFNDYEYKYKIQDKEQEILRLETSKKLEQEKNKLLKIGFILLLVIIVGISLLAYSINGNRKKEKHINDLINKQNEALEQHNKFKDKVFSIIAHDLRSPIASIQSMFSLLDQGLISQEDFMTFRKDMTHQVNTLSLLLENLLSWSKKQMQKGLQTTKSVVVIKEIIDQNLALFNEISISKQIDIKSTVFEDLKIMADVDQFDLIIRNLLSNAIKFTPKGGSILLDAKEEKGQIKISVKDSGIGMIESTIDKIFANEIVSHKGTNGEKGTGLGLSLTKEFIENNNGTFNICSKPNKGTEITITFNQA